MMLNWVDQKFFKKNKKRKATHLTMMVVPHGNGTSVKKYCFPMWMIKSFLAVSVICIMTVGYFVTGFFYLQFVAKENKVLKNINTAQAKEISELKDLASGMKGKLEALIKLDQEVRAKVGLTRLSTENKAVGGLGSSRTSDRYFIMTMGLGPLGSNNITASLTTNAVRPYVTESFSLSSVVKNEESININQEEQIMELPIPDGEADTLEDLVEQMKQMDSFLTHQAELIDKLNSDVDKQIAYQNAMPTLWPLQGRLTCGYGWRSNPFSKRGSEFHEGIDIAASYGSAIRAAGDGVVIYSGWKGSWGKIVIVSHGYGYVSQYAHNSSLVVKAGDKVKRGQVIARLGSTGRSTGPHLHFGIAKNGQWVNPLKILK